MSIMIDMEMPKRCLECPMYDNYNYYCTLYSFGIPVRYNLDGSTRPEWCEIKELPPAQQERKKGHWKLLNNGDAICSECGRRQKGVWDFDNWDNFCRHCGCDMRGESE